QSVRLAADGTASAARLVAHGPGAEAQPVVAFGGGRLLVAWEDRRQDKQHGDVYAARLGTDGEMLDPDGIAVATGPAAQRAPAVTRASSWPRPPTTNPGRWSGSGATRRRRWWSGPASRRRAGRSPCRRPTSGAGGRPSPTLGCRCWSRRRGTNGRGWPATVRT